MASRSHPAAGAADGSRAVATAAHRSVALTGPRTLACDPDAARAALAEIRQHGDIDLLLILQITFTDASMTTEIARTSSAPAFLPMIVTQPERRSEPQRPPALSRQRFSVLLAI